MSFIRFLKPKTNIVRIREPIVLLREKFMKETYSWERRVLFRRYCMECPFFQQANLTCFASK